ncbi:sensor histidine kinase [Athalassotoga saccharophila]|uniref:sensor histidine kinase n=1 Tax=Athalassotoga saccharophila TaxID=1441386 RepID=UPI00137B6B1D|nr:ATP-binding protein [Athalassotoga saccharophila]BBJ28178.1 alkaline phosphatase synthesis sensor protein PhoR [Athalassotoga saccharophila]
MRIIDFVSEGIVSTDQNLNIVDHNDTISTNFEVSFQRAVKLTDVISFSKMNEALQTSLNGHVFSEQLPVFFGTKKIECKVTVFTEGPLIRWIFKNLDDIKMLENAKADFVSAVSHEFMTPLGIIEGFLEIIKDPKVDEKSKAQYIERAENQLKRLEKLVDQLLYLSALEMETYIPKFSIVNLYQMAQEAREEMAYRCKAKNINVEIEIPENLFIKTDGTALYRITTNLLSNAIKYSWENSSVKISAKEDEKLVRISVEDHGIGIKSEEIPRIFERFYRASNASETDAKGMGLGLALVKHLAKIINAKIEVNSKYTFGSTFTVVIPKR